MKAEARTFTPFIPSKDLAGTQPDLLRYPDVEELSKVLSNLGAPPMSELYPHDAAAIRGSTAVFVRPDDKADSMNRRAPSSDNDVVYCYSPTVGEPKPYSIRVVNNTEYDILYVTPERLEKERKGRGTFYHTKMVHPHVPILNPSQYEQVAVNAMTTMIQRGACREENDTMTTSGGIRHILTSDLLAEYWRITSLRTYYKDAPYALRARVQTYALAERALQQMVAHNQAQSNGINSNGEEVFKISLEPNDGTLLTANKGFYGQILTTGIFIFQQLEALIQSHQGFSWDNAKRLLAKLHAIANDPFVVDADAIFK